MAIFMKNLRLYKISNTKNINDTVLEGVEIHLKLTAGAFIAAGTKGRGGTEERTVGPHGPG